MGNNTKIRNNKNKIIIYIKNHLHEINKERNKYQKYTQLKSRQGTIHRWQTLILLIQSVVLVNEPSLQHTTLAGIRLTNKNRCPGEVHLVMFSSRSDTAQEDYLDFASHHPIVHKAAVVRTLFSRAATVSSCAVSLRDEHAHIKHTLGANHYPVW